jgi:hypothetical protein
MRGLERGSAATWLMSAMGLLMVWCWCGCDGVVCACVVRAWLRVKAKAKGWQTVVLIKIMVFLAIVKLADFAHQ